MCSSSWDLLNLKLNIEVWNELNNFVWYKKSICSRRFGFVSFRNEQVLRSLWSTLWYKAPSRVHSIQYRKRIVPILCFSMNHVNLFIFSFWMLVQEVQNAIKDLNGRNKWSSFSIHRFNMVDTSFSIHWFNMVIEILIRNRALFQPAFYWGKSWLITACVLVLSGIL